MSDNFNGRKTSLVYLERDGKCLFVDGDEGSCAQTGVAGRRKGGEK